MVLGFKTKTKDGRYTNFVEKIAKGEKIHTIREDKHNRWCDGRKIHASVGVRTPKYRCFFVGICHSVQDIEILIMDKSSLIIIVDKKLLLPKEIAKLIVNDGFNSCKEFMEWFDYKNFTGKIIHWTDFKY